MTAHLGSGSLNSFYHKSAFNLSQNLVQHLRDNCDLLSGIPLPEVVITKEEQLKAISHLSEVHGSDQRSESISEGMSVDMSKPTHKMIP